MIQIISSTLEAKAKPLQPTNLYKLDSLKVNTHIYHRTKEHFFNIKKKNKSTSFIRAKALQMIVIIGY